MAAIKGKDTKPEWIVRRLLYGMGYRYRLHVKGIPGKPDVVFVGRKAAIFVHGCFWHGHDCRRGGRVPKDNHIYWVAKLSRNVERDDVNRSSLKAAGWHVLVVWECETKDREVLGQRLKDFLGPTKFMRKKDL
jgi:DNA mismatch endonuclease (patch repair protein)